MIAQLRFKIRLRFRKISSLKQPILIALASDDLAPGQVTEERARSQESSSDGGSGWEEPMRSIRRAALALAVTLAFSGLALARDHDDHWKDKHAYSHHEENHGWDHVWNRGRDHDRNRNWNWGRDRDNDGWRESAREREWERERIRQHEIW